MSAPLISVSPRLGHALRPVFTALGFLLALGPAGWAQDRSLNVVHENALEFSTTGDWDGDGSVDLVVLDKVSGFVRFGFQTAPLHFEWSEPDAAGLENLTGCSAGLLLAAGRHSLALAAPEANRVQVLSVSQRGQPAQLTSVYPSGIGPSLVLSVPAVITTNLRHDLLVGTTWNGANPDRLEVLSNTTQDFMPRFVTPATAPARQANRARLETAGPEYGAALCGSTGLVTLQIWQPAAATLVEVAAVTNLPAATCWLAGTFDASGYDHFLCYEPGQGKLTVRRAARLTSGRLGFGSPVVFDVGRPVAQWRAVPGTNETRLLALFADGPGQQAAIYSFDGRTAPQLVRLFSGSGDPFSGAAVLPGGHLVLFTGDGSGRTSGFQVHKRSGSDYVQVEAGALPSLANRVASANVLFFRADPFDRRGAPLVGAQRQRDWTSQIHFTNSPSGANLTAEVRGDETTGLHDSLTAAIKPAPAGAQAGLVNQLSETMSVFTFTPAAGSIMDSVQIAPAPGSFPTTVQVTLSSGQADTLVYYRLGSAANWLLYAQPFFITRTTTVQYFAQRPGGGRGAVASGLYRIAQLVEPNDSDADSVPDFVELANGLDPAGGWDADGDGVSDLVELWNRTNPADPLSKPASALDLQASYDLLVTPRPWDGTTESNTWARATSTIRGFSLEGAWLSSAPILEVFSPTKPLPPRALLTNLAVRFDHRLLVLATEPHFEIATTSLDQRVGRELLGLAPQPVIPVPVVAYQDHGGTAAEEANAWLTALRQTGALQNRATAMAELTVNSTLTALLLERKIGGLLVLRAQVSSPRVTLFPFRPADAERIPITASMLGALEHQLTVTAAHVEPGYALGTMFESLRTQVESKDNPASANLRAVVENLYTISALSRGATSAIPSPIEAIRQLLEAGTLPAAYANDPRLPKALVSQAALAAATLLAAVPARPTQQYTLRIISTSTGCTTLENLNGIPVHLVDGEGNPYHLSELFPLLPGSLLNVIGYSDVTAACGGQALEVIRADLQAIPAASGTDQDGNQLADTWERFFFGIIGQDPLADADGDLYSNLQEYLEGSSPTDTASRPSVPPQTLPQPVIQIQRLADGRFRLSWSWPEAYSQAVQFGIRSSDDLRGGFVEQSVTPVQSGPGSYEAWLNSPHPRQGFFQVYYRLTR